MEIGPEYSNSERNNDKKSEESCLENRKGDELEASSTAHVAFGPVLPPGFHNHKSMIGPSRPLPLDVNPDVGIGCIEDEGVIGPEPLSNDDNVYIARCKAEIESRSKEKKDKLMGNKERKPAKIDREEWMVELPAVRQNFGLCGRKFRSKDLNLGDRSVWTETPDKCEKKKRKQTFPSEQKEKETKDYDIAKYVTEHNKHHRSESLLDLHEKHRKSKKKKEENHQRRPFDRELDLGTRKMDTSERKSLIKQSSNFNSKFEHSKQGPAYL